MIDIILVNPTLEDEIKVMDYKNEFLTNGDSMDGTSSLRNANSYQEWYSALIDNSNADTVRPGLVPSTTYLAIRQSDQRLVGMIDIRHKLNDYLINFGGNIGYSVRKSERRKGYAKEMLRLALEKCSSFGIEKALVTCDFDNIASAKTILANGGEFENEVLDEYDGVMVQRYWIKIK